MTVEVLSQTESLNIPQVAFLKLYDRRCSSQWRSDWGIDPWTPNLENQLLEFSRSDDAVEFMGHLDDDSDDDGSDGDDDNLTDAQYEASLSHELQKLCETERIAYEKLSRHQGNLIPRLYAVVKLETASAEGYESPFPDLFEVPGILIEHINGITFAQLASSTIDRSMWQYLGDRAVQVTNIILQDSDVLNTDVRPANMMVCQDKGYEQGYRVVMIDFGHCRFRRRDEPIEEWGLAKHRQDEEGAMGAVLQIQLRKAGFDFQYKRGLNWIDYAEGD